VEARGELLVDAGVGIDQHVAWIAVYPTDCCDLDRDPGFLGDLADHGLSGALSLTTSGSRLQVQMDHRLFVAGPVVVVVQATSSWTDRKIIGHGQGTRSPEKL
jgi:hypothetical protein